MARINSDEDEAVAAAARRAVAHLIKSRARHYARRPMALERLYPGLSRVAPDRLAAIGAHLVEREARVPRRWFGFGGEVTLINAKAVCLLGRARRRAARVGSGGYPSTG